VKKIAVVPALLTLGNGVCGFIAIIFASKILDRVQETDEANFMWAGWFILFGMVFDMLDGYVARLTKTASEFGGELDSLCDVVTFGVAPAFLLLKLGPGGQPNPVLHAVPFLQQIVIGIAALYFACTALRLARFNVENDPDPASHKRFQGLPSPGAAGCIGALAIVRGEFSSLPLARWLAIDIVQVVEIMSPIGALIVALLMVSNVPYPHLTGRIFRGRKPLGHLVQVLLAAIILLTLRSLSPLLIFWIYAFVFPVRSLVIRNLRGEPKPDEHSPHKL
jgi:CDP-diacylglycerol--serine O-phosphatidyltransferase